MRPSPSTRRGIAGFIRRRIRADGSQQGAQTLMLAASVTPLVASDHEQRAFLRPSEADHRCPGGVVSVARPSSFLARKPRDSSPRGVDLAARGFWKLTAIAIVVNAALAVGAYGISSFTHTDGIPLIFIWFPLYLCAALPHLIEKSVRPFWSSRPHYEDGSIVIPGNHQSPSHSSRPDSCCTPSQAGRWPRVSRPDSPSTPPYMCSPLRPWPSWSAAAIPAKTSSLP